MKTNIVYSFARILEIETTAITTLLVINNIMYIPTVNTVCSMQH